MAVYASKSAEARALKGVHLYHFAMSNCSQRVRIALEAKGVSWTSHHVNLPASEHLTPAYLEINPNGVVPTLVHDGQVILESNDIIAYIDETFPGPRLGPITEAGRAETEALMARAGAVQGALKVLSHELLFKKFRKVSAADAAAMEAAGAQPALVSFMRDYSEDGPAWAVRVASARAEMDAALAGLEDCLRSGRSWLNDEGFGLADISWIVNLHRLQQCHYDLSAYPRLRDWTARAAQEPSFIRAVAEYRV